MFFLSNRPYARSKTWFFLPSKPTPAAVEHIYFYLLDLKLEVRAEHVFIPSRPLVKRKHVFFFKYLADLRSVEAKHGFISMQT
jgi:hypothetical protein